MSLQVRLRVVSTSVSLYVDYKREDVKKALAIYVARKLDVQDRCVLRATIQISN